ncbi:MAG TPA: hypothetical protein PLT66_08860 [Bacillota bacterium]|nr:hypothetical protein [Bacillota bacterium]
MKKLGLILALLMLVMCFASCGDNTVSQTESTQESKQETSIEESTEESEPEELKDPEIVPHPMTVTITSDKKFVMTTTLDNGSTMSVCWDKKDWGTWNIGSYKVGSTDYTTNATDWEYVFRAAENGSAGYAWSGGNHGNEALTELKIYDGETGEELSYTVGATYECSLLKVVESTRLNTGNAAEPYADVVRTYTVAGKTVTLGCTFDFTREMYFYMSYTTMFPISKTAGYRTVYNHTDKTTAEYLSTYYEKNPSAANFTGYFDYGHEAESVDIYPKVENNTHFHIEIYRSDDMTGGFDNSQKTFLWDMSSTQNKLYFSRFTMDSATRVEAGTHWYTLASWEFIYD